MNRAIRYRVYPTTEQAVMFAKTFGCCRKVWNLMLSDKVEGYEATGKFPMVTPEKYKADYPYLKEVDSLALANVQLNLQTAFKNCFSKTRNKKTGFPKYKSAKRSHRSYTTNNQRGTVAIIDNKYIKLPRVGLEASGIKVCQRSGLLPTFMPEASKMPGYFGFDKSGLPEHAPDNVLSVDDTSLWILSKHQIHCTHQTIAVPVGQIRFHQCSYPALLQTLPVLLPFPHDWSDIGLTYADDTVWNAVDIVEVHVLLLLIDFPDHLYPL